MAAQGQTEITRPAVSAAIGAAGRRAGTFRVDPTCGMCDVQSEIQSEIRGPLPDALGTGSRAALSRSRSPRLRKHLQIDREPATSLPVPTIFLCLDPEDEAFPVAMSQAMQCRGPQLRSCEAP